MTVIVGYRVPGGVVMASDSHTIGGDAALRVKEKKLHSLAPDVILGSTGRTRFAQIAAKQPPPEMLPNQTRRDALHDWVGKLRRELSLQGALTENDEGQDASGNTSLLAWADRLYYIASNFAVHEPEQDYMAIGSGEDWAIGALEALDYIESDLSPVVRCRVAVHVATSRNVYCLPPICITDTLTSDGETAA